MIFRFFRYAFSVCEFFSFFEWFVGFYSNLELTNARVEINFKHAHRIHSRNEFLAGVSDVLKWIITVEL